MPWIRTVPCQEAGGSNPPTPTIDMLTNAEPLPLRPLRP